LPIVDGRGLGQRGLKQARASARALRVGPSCVCPYRGGGEFSKRAQALACAMALRSVACGGISAGIAASDGPSLTELSRSAPNEATTHTLTPAQTLTLALALALAGSGLS